MATKQIKFGSIPARLKIFLRRKTDIKFRWDDIEAGDDIAIVSGYPAFITDITNSKTQETAQRWANYHDDKKHHGFIERDNTPITNVRIIGLDIRGNGGRAWQVLVDEEYVIDMREDVLMDTILHSGATPGGHLQGEFVFASVNSEMKIIRVGSLLHEKMLESTAFTAKASITNLEVGGIYRNKKATVIYLGEVYTREYVEEECPRDGRFDYRRHPGKYSLRDSTRKYVTVEIGANNKVQPEDMKTMKDFNNRFFMCGLNWNNTIPKSFREKVGQISEDTQGIIDYLRDAWIKEDSMSNRTSKRDFVWYSSMLNAEATKTDFIHPLIKNLL